MSYESYDYLQGDIRQVKLCKVVGRLPERIVELSPEEEERAMHLHKESIIIDFHLHTRVLPEKMEDMEDYIRSGRIATGYEGIAQSGMAACFVGFLGGVGRRHFPIPFQ